MEPIDDADMCRGRFGTINPERNDMLTTTVKLSQKSIRKVERLAHRRDVSFSDVVEYAVGRLVATEEVLYMERKRRR